MQITHVTAIHNRGICISPAGKPQDVVGGDFVSRNNCTENSDFFESERLRVDSATWRFSPRIPGLSAVKRAILAGYAFKVISLRIAQRLIDATKSWEA